MVCICLLLTLLAAGCFIRACNSRAKAGLVAVGVLLALVLSGAYLLADHLTDDGINEAVLYHLTMDTSGVGLGDFATPMAITFVYVLATLAISFAIFWFSFTPTLTLSAQYRWLTGMTMMLTAITVNPGTSGLINLAEVVIQSGSPQDQPKDYLALDPNTISLDGKNLIYLYVESLELNYLDETIFPGLTPQLQRLRKEATEFSGVSEAWGTSWTIAGMVGSQCGIPLISPGEGNSASGAGQFLPKATCLGDILKRQGYSLHYMGGAALSFAGKGLFYRDHGFERIDGVDELLAETPNSDYRNWWGLYDDTLYPLLTKRIKQLASAPQPFALFGLTLDTHHPKGHVSSSCEDSPYRDGSNPILNAVHCADQLISKFVATLKNNDLLSNTILVIASDHLALPNTATAQLKLLPRKNLVLVFDNALPAQNVTKLGTTLDISPTLLNLLGSEVKGLGFGRDLLAEEPTLVQAYPDLSKYLISHRGYLRGLWDFPQIFLGAEIDTNNQIIQLEEQSLKLPIALKLNHTLQIEDMIFDFSTRTRLQERIKKLDDHQRFIWIDTCMEIAPLLSAAQRPRDTKYCLSYGTLAARRLHIQPLQQNSTVVFKDISTYFENMTAVPDQASRRRENLTSYRLTGLLDVNLITTTAPLAHQISITSVGGPYQSRSYIKSQTNANLLEAKRGVTLFGVKSDSSMQELVRVDTCSAAIRDGLQTPPNFSHHTALHGDTFAHYVILSHDSALCRQSRLEPILKGLPLETWRTLSLREPYIAVISDNKKISETKGRRDSSLSAVLTQITTQQ